MLGFFFQIVPAMRAIISALAFVALAADFKDVNPNVFGPDDARLRTE